MESDENVEYLCDEEDNKPVYIYQCLLCLEKFEAEPFFEKLLLNHYYAMHAPQTDDEPSEKRTKIKDECYENNVEEWYEDNVEEIAVEDNVEEIVVEDESQLTTQLEIKILSDESTENVDYIEETKFDEEEILESYDNDIDLQQQQQEMEISDVGAVQTDVVVEYYAKFASEEIIMKPEYDDDTGEMEIEKEEHCVQNNIQKVFRCLLCSEKFPTRELCQEHLDKHQNPEYECNICHSIYQTLQTYQKHIRTAHNYDHENEAEDAKYQCDICDKRWKSHDKLMEHKLKHKTKNFNIQCMHCKKMFLLLSKCELHLEVEHQITENFMDHIIDVHIDKKSEYQCQYCLSHFKQKRNWVAHEALHFPPKYSCTDCPAKFYNLIIYNRHLKTKHGKIHCHDEVDDENEKQNWDNRFRRKEFFIQCLECENKFYLLTQCKEHLTNDHGITDNLDNFIIDLNSNSDKKYRCQYCYKRCLSRTNFINHERTHRDPEFRCKVCKTRIHTYGSLKRHLLQVHRTEIDFPNPDVSDGKITYSSPAPRRKWEDGAAEVMCDICGKMVRRHVYSKHLARHTGSWHVCNICKRSFANKSYLTLHIRVVHFNDRPFSCTICPATYTDSVGLSYHMQAAHSDERPYICEICSANFKVKQSLRIHMLTHTGIKNYKCLPCGKAYSRSANRKKHNRSVHGIALTKIPLNDVQPDVSSNVE